MPKSKPACSLFMLASFAAAGCKGDATKPASSNHLVATGPGASGTSAATDACAPEVFDALLQKYVVDGKIDYARWKATTPDAVAFDAYLARIGACDVGKLEDVAQEAFWVNAYNAFNIKGVLEKYPIENIKSVPGFLDKRTWHVANLDLTLNDIEYKHVIPARKDAREHFAVVCADLGSVPIKSNVYTPASLEADLEAQTKAFVADPHNFNVDVANKVVNVSMLFSPEWYEKDYLADTRFKGKNAVEYLIPYVDKRTADFLASGDYTVKYIDWNWALNQTAAN